MLSLNLTHLIDDAKITAGTMVYTDEYAIYNSLQDWGNDLLI